MKHSFLVNSKLSYFIALIIKVPGTLVEIAYTKYHKNYLGRNIFVLLDGRTISGRLNPEVEEELDLRYFSSAEELNGFLKS